MVISELAPNNRPSFLTVYSSNKKLEHNQCFTYSMTLLYTLPPNFICNFFFSLSVPDVTKSGRAA